MDEKLDDLLYESLQPANNPDPELNRRILDRKVSNMRKFNMRKTVAAAAAIGILVAVGGVSVYAATQNHSLLSWFQGEEQEVKDRAAELLDTNVDQETATDQEFSQWATFKIREAIVDKIQVRIQVEVKAADPDKYLLVPLGVSPSDKVVNLRMEGLSGKQTIEEYAESIGKQCILVDMNIDSAIPAETTASSFGSNIQSVSHCMEKDGTIVYDVKFGNDMRGETLEYVCETSVCPDPENRDNWLRDKINFTLTDETDMEMMKYLPVSNKEVSGTNLVIDEVTFEKGDLEAVCNIIYHYAGKEKDWLNTTDADIWFFLLDSRGKIIKSSDGVGEPADDGITYVLSLEYSLKDLPDIFVDGGNSKDTIVLQAKSIRDEKLYGTMELKLAE